MLVRGRTWPAGCNTAAMLQAGSHRRVALKPAPQQGRQAWAHIDKLLLAAMATLTMVYAGAVHVRLDDRFFTIPAGNDVWFEGDGPVVADRIVHRWSDQSRNAQHPLFPLWTTVPSYVMRLASLNPPQRIAVITVAAAAVWGAIVFELFRGLTRTRMEALSFSALTYVTSAAMFWLPSVETYVLGSATLLVPLTLMARDSVRPLPDGWYVAASAASLSVTITNWISGIVVSVMSRPMRRAIQISANALVAVVVLWALQSTFVAAPFFLAGNHDTRFFFHPLSGGPVRMTRALVVHSVVMPRLDVVPEPKWGPRWTVQTSPLGSSGPVGAIATILWLALLSAGAAALALGKAAPALRRAVVPTLAAQLLLYNCYGEESFLYSLNVAPLLVACASASTALTTRRWVLIGTWVLIVLLTVNNSTQLSRAMQFFVLHRQ